MLQIFFLDILHKQYNMNFVWFYFTIRYKCLLEDKGRKIQRKNIFLLLLLSFISYNEFACVLKGENRFIVVEIFLI